MVVNEEVNKKIIMFFNIAICYVGKEIKINSNNEFDIDEVWDNHDKEGEYYYHIEYKYGNKGLIVLDYSYVSEGNCFKINNVVFYLDDNIDLQQNNSRESIELLDSAINDLNNAIVLGECRYPVEEQGFSKKISLNRHSHKM